MSIPLGIRLNNPGNIERGQKWKGLAVVQAHPRFCTFTDPKWGIRVIAYLMCRYWHSYKIRTIAGAITRYAPPEDNDTAAYIRSVAKRSGLPPDRPLNLGAAPTLEKIVPAIIHHENGRQPYSLELVREGVRLALESFE